MRFRSLSSFLSSITLERYIVVYIHSFIHPQEYKSYLKRKRLVMGIEAWILSSFFHMPPRVNSPKILYLTYGVEANRIWLDDFFLINWVPITVQDLCRFSFLREILSPWAVKTFFTIKERNRFFFFLLNNLISNFITPICITTTIFRFTVRIFHRYLYYYSISN
jgi:hypothetical protein